MCNLFSVLYCLFYFSYFIEVAESFISRPNVTYRNSSLNIICYRKLKNRGIPKRPQCLRPGKEKFVKEFKEQLQHTKAILQFRSIHMNCRLRNHIKENLNKNLTDYDMSNPPYKMRLVKNTLMKIAIDGTPFEPLTPNIKNTNYYILVFDDTIVPKMMAVINGIRKAAPITRKCFEPLFACFGEVAHPAAHMKNLSSLPSKDELCQRIPSLLRFPMTKMVESISLPQKLLNPINQVFSNLAYTLRQVKPKESSNSSHNDTSDSSKVSNSTESTDSGSSGSPSSTHSSSSADSSNSTNSSSSIDSTNSNSPTNLDNSSNTNESANTTTQSTNTDTRDNTNTTDKSDGSANSNGSNDSDNKDTTNDSTNSNNTN